MAKAIFVATALATLTGACASVDYSRLEPGHFSGSVIVMWVGEGGSSGDGVFLFVPDPANPLVFARADSRKPGAVVRPRMMYTDGGSIPRIAQVFRGFSPWGYAPAYMIHDWLFTARHCLVDGNDTQRYADVKDVTFEDSAEILGEAIRSLVEERRVQPNDVAGSTITGAVASSIARNLWDERGACAGLQVKAADVAAAEAAIKGSSKFAAGPALPPGGLAYPGAAPARVVARITF